MSCKMLWFIINIEKGLRLKTLDSLDFNTK